MSLCFRGVLGSRTIYANQRNNAIDDGEGNRNIILEQYLMF